MHLPLGPPSHLSSLLPFVKKCQKNGTSHKKIFWMKTNTRRDETPKIKLTELRRREWHHNTFTPSLHLVPFCQLCTLQNSIHALSLFTLVFSLCYATLLKKCAIYAHEIVKLYSKMCLTDTGLIFAVHANGQSDWTGWWQWWTGCTGSVTRFSCSLSLNSLTETGLQLHAKLSVEPSLTRDEANNHTHTLS